MRLFLTNKSFSSRFVEMEYGRNCSEPASIETADGIQLSVPDHLLSAELLPEYLHTENEADLSVISAWILLKLCESREQKLSLAESCTGGTMASRLTAFPGSSRVFDFSAVTYSNSMKHRVLSVPWEILDEYGAVSARTVEMMYRGVLKINPGTGACAVSGIAGPGGGSTEKPVGLVYIATGWNDRSPDIRKRLFSGDRRTIQHKAVVSANVQLIHGLLNC